LARRRRRTILICLFKDKEEGHLSRSRSRSLNCPSQGQRYRGQGSLTVDHQTSPATRRHSPRSVTSHNFPERKRVGPHHLLPRRHQRPHGHPHLLSDSNLNLRTGRSRMMSCPSRHSQTFPPLMPLPLSTPRLLSHPCPHRGLVRHHSLSSLSSRQRRSR
jgi:hypothetical protein